MYECSTKMSHMLVPSVAHSWKKNAESVLSVNCSKCMWVCMCGMQSNHPCSAFCPECILLKNLPQYDVVLYYIYGYHTEGSYESHCTCWIWPCVCRGVPAHTLTLMLTLSLFSEVSGTERTPCTSLFTEGNITEGHRRWSQHGHGQFIWMAKVNDNPVCRGGIPPTRYNWRKIILTPCFGTLQSITLHKKNKKIGPYAHPRNATWSMLVAIMCLMQQACHVVHMRLMAQIY